MKKRKGGKLRESVTFKKITNAGTSSTLDIHHLMPTFVPCSFIAAHHFTLSFLPLTFYSYFHLYIISQARSDYHCFQIIPSDHFSQYICKSSDQIIACLWSLYPTDLS